MLKRNFCQKYEPEVSEIVIILTGYDRNNFITCFDDTNS
jgi:hypothetical protein